MKLLGISGSLRQASYNTRLLEIARNCLPSDCDFLLYTCGNLPLYNQDLDTEEKPAPVIELLELIDSSDGLLLAAAEYNYSVSGVLKNALDWASRPAFKSVLKDRPAAILSASMSPLGGIRSQIHLKQILGSTLTPIFPAPDFILPKAQGVFASDGKILDPSLEERLQHFLRDFVIWVKERA